MGSAVALDKSFLKKSLFLEKSSAPGSAAAPTVRILRNNIPQAAQLPRTSGLFKKKTSIVLVEKMLRASSFQNIWKKSYLKEVHSNQLMSTVLEV